MSQLEAVVLVTPRSFGRADPQLRMSLEGRVGEVRYIPSPGLSPHELVPIVGDVDGWIAGLDLITSDVIERAPRLRVIARYGVGTDRVDLEAARRRKIVVTNTPDANADAVAELAIGFFFALARRIPWADSQVRAGRWPSVLGHELAGGSVGVVGLGAVGKRVALLARAIGCTVLASDPAGDSSFAADRGIELTDLETLLASADFVTLHVPLVAGTIGMVNRDFLQQMRPGAFLVNVARGELVDDEAVSDALASGRLAGVAFDAHSQEPIAAGHALLRCDTAILTSHIGSHTTRAFSAMGWMALEDCLAVLNGDPPRYPVLAT